ncbi:MAG TPA: hypothetical protein PKZ76_08730 [Xanthomonadaceae bacterium]|nr:hypothetical protein [Xanthomonadaceae bacterium]
MSTHNSILRATAVLGLLVVGLAVWSVPLPAQAAGNQVAGYWLVHGIPDPATGLPPFNNLASLSGDGQVINVDPGIGTAVGGWERLAGRRYAVTFTGFLDGSGSRYVVTAVLSLQAGGQELHGRFHTQFMDPLGNVFFEFGGDVMGLRQ